MGVWYLYKYNCGGVRGLTTVNTGGKMNIIDHKLLISLIGGC